MSMTTTVLPTMNMGCGLLDLSLLQEMGCVCEVGGKLNNTCFVDDGQPGPTGISKEQEYLTEYKLRTGGPLDTRGALALFRLGHRPTVLANPERPDVKPILFTSTNNDRPPRNLGPSYYYFRLSGLIYHHPEMFDAMGMRALYSVMLPPNLQTNKVITDTETGQTQYIHGMFTDGTFVYVKTASTHHSSVAQEPAYQKGVLELSQKPNVPAVLKHGDHRLYRYYYEATLEQNNGFFLKGFLRNHGIHSIEEFDQLTDPDAIIDILVALLNRSHLSTTNFKEDSYLAIADLQVALLEKLDLTPQMLAKIANNDEIKMQSLKLGNEDRKDIVDVFSKVQGNDPVKILQEAVPLLSAWFNTAFPDSPKSELDNALFPKDAQLLCLCIVRMMLQYQRLPVQMICIDEAIRLLMEQLPEIEPSDKDVNKSREYKRSRYDSALLEAVNDPTHPDRIQFAIEKTVEILLNKFVDDHNIRASRLG